MYNTQALNTKHFAHSQPKAVKVKFLHKTNILANSAADHNACKNLADIGGSEVQLASCRMLAYKSFVEKYTYPSSWIKKTQKQLGSNTHNQKLLNVMDMLARYRLTAHRKKKNLALLSDSVNSSAKKSYKAKKLAVNELLFNGPNATK